MPVVVPAGPAHASPCPKPPPAVKDLTLAAYDPREDGAKHSPNWHDPHRHEVSPLATYLRRVSGDADRSMTAGTDKDRKAAGACALDWLESWAKADALLGRMSSTHSEHERIRDLAGLSLAYLKARPSSPPAQRKFIEQWLIALADTAQSHFETLAIRRDPSRHMVRYWHGLAMAGVGLAAASQRHWSEARAFISDLSATIGPDGKLPAASSQKGRTLHEHAFALTPLVVMAELAQAQGEDWYAPGEGALHRLVRLTSRGLDDPNVFAKLTGIAQDRPVNPGAGWLALYQRRFSDRLPATLPEVPASHRWLGGDVRLLGEALGTNR